MARKIFAIKDHKIVSDADVLPFSEENMDKFCREQGWDNWFYLDEDAALFLTGVKP
jgi:hypothetical protein